MLSSVKSRGESEADILHKYVVLFFLILDDDDDNLRLVMPPFLNFETHTTFWKIGSN